MDEPDEPAAVGVARSRRVGDEHEVAGHVRPEVVVHVARVDEIVVADGPVARGPQQARRSVDALVAEVGEASRRRIEHLALDAAGCGVQRPSLEHRGERDEHDGVAGIVCVYGRGGGDTGRDPRGAALALA